MLWDIQKSVGQNVTPHQHADLSSQHSFSWTGLIRRAYRAEYVCDLKKKKKKAVTTDLCYILRKNTTANISVLWRYFLEPLNTAGVWKCKISPGHSVNRLQGELWISATAIWEKAPLCLAAWFIEMLGYQANAPPLDSLYSGLLAAAAKFWSFTWVNKTFSENELRGLRSSSCSLGWGFFSPLGSLKLSRSVTGRAFVSPAVGTTA